MGGEKSERMSVEVKPLKIGTGRWEILFPILQDASSSFRGLVAAIEVDDGIGSVEFNEWTPENGNHPKGLDLPRHSSGAPDAPVGGWDVFICHPLPDGRGI
jgi:hypothetical protein